MHSIARRLPPWLPIAVLLAAVPTVAHAHGQQALFVPLGQLAALIPAAVIAWRLTRGIAASETSSFLTGFVASTIVAVVVALSWRRLLWRDRHGI
jgi:hypothetical protein